MHEYVQKWLESINWKNPKNLKSELKTQNYNKSNI